jgi:hypothetical protein
VLGHVQRSDLRASQFLQVSGDVSLVHVGVWWGAVDDAQADPTHELEAHVAAGVGPLVCLLHLHGADEADDRGPVGEDPDRTSFAAGSPW